MSGRSSGEGHRIEGGREALGLAVPGQVLEALVGAEGVALAGEHARRVLALALEGEDAAGIGEAAGQVLLEQPGQDVAVVLEPGQRDLGDLGAGQRRRRELGAHLPVADPDHVLLARVALLHLGPDVDQLAAARIERRLALGNQRVERRAVLAGVRQHAPGLAELLALAGDRRLFAHEAVVGAHRLGHLGQIALAAGRHHGRARRGRHAVDRRQGARPGSQAARVQGVQQAVVERGHTVVVEVGCDRAVDRHVLGPLREGLAAALDLLAHVAQRVPRAPAVELVDRDEVGEVQHVDLLELAGGAELRRHDVERAVDLRDDAGVALADARGLDDDQAEAGRLAGGDDVGQAGRGLALRAAGGERAHVDLRAVDRIHADAVAEQRAAALAFRGVDGDQRDAPLGIVEAEAAHQLVGHRGLAGAAGAGDAEHRDRRRLLRRLVQFRREARIQNAAFQGRDDPRQDPPVAGQPVERGRRLRGQVEIGCL